MLRKQLNKTRKCIKLQCCTKPELPFKGQAACIFTCTVGTFDIDKYISITEPKFENTSVFLDSETQIYPKTDLLFYGKKHIGQCFIHKIEHFPHT